MIRLMAAIRIAAQDFGGLILFWVVLRQFGLRPAIAATLLFVLLDGARRLIRRLPMPRIWLFSNAMALIFGIIDLHAGTPFMIRYEAVLTNLISAAVFLIGASGAKPMIQELAEQRQGRSFEERPDLRLFFKALTLLWAAYFLVKALAYLWVARRFPIEQAVAIRAVAGTGSFALMLLLSWRSRPLHALALRCGLLPSRQA